MLSPDKFRSVMSVKEHMVYGGKAFRMFYEATVPPEGEHAVSILNGANTVHLFKRLVQSDQPAVRYDVRTGAIFTGYTTVIPVRPLNGMSNAASTNTVRLCSVSNIGDLSDLDIAGGVVGVGNRAEGSTMSDPDDLKILPPDEEFLLRLVNPNTDPAHVLVYLKWYELPYSA